MTAMERRRLRLSAPAGRLAGFDGQAALGLARSRLSQLRNDVELTDVEKIAPDAVGVSLRIAPPVSDDDIAADLRAVLEIGPGGHEVVDATGLLWGGLHKAIGGEEDVCSCGGVGGFHFPDCQEVQH
jgi:hypothetical protein